MRIFAYPWDLADEGVDRTLAMFRSMGITSVAIAVNYHSAKLFLPHNPRRKVYFPEAGRFYYPMEAERFRQSAIQPLNSEWSKEHAAFWSELAEASARHNITLTAWTIGIHNTTLGYQYPQWVMRNAFGDPYYYSLCLSHEPVRRYLALVAESLGTFAGFQELFLESFQFMDFEHGFHHEMTGIALNAHTQALLSLCFCDACVAQAARQGIDADRIRKAVAGEVEAVAALRGSASPDRAPWGNAGELREYLAFRQSIVTGLVREIREACGKPLVFFGKPPEEARWNGVDYAALARWVDRIEGYHYKPGTDDIIQTVKAYGSVIDRSRLRLALRAGSPDTETPEQLVRRIAAALQTGIAGLSLYNYGQVPLPHWRALEKGGRYQEKEAKENEK